MMYYREERGKVSFQFEMVYAKNFDSLDGNDLIDILSNTLFFFFKLKKKKVYIWSCLLDATYIVANQFLWSKLRPTM